MTITRVPATRRPVAKGWALEGRAPPSPAKDGVPPLRIKKKRREKKRKKEEKRKRERNRKKEERKIIIVIKNRFFAAKPKIIRIG